MYIIKDWAGNTLYNGQTFETFDDAWDHIMTNAPDDVENDPEYFSEFQAVEI